MHYTNYCMVKILPQIFLEPLNSHEIHWFAIVFALLQYGRNYCQRCLLTEMLYDHPDYFKLLEVVIGTNTPVVS